MTGSAHRLEAWLVPTWGLITLGWWALAFYPVSNSTPAWLDLAQSVCFGTLENGLPDSYGWLMLLGMPSGLALGLWTSHADEYRALWRRQPAFRTAVFCLAAALAAQSAWVTWRVRQALAIDNLSFQPVLDGPLPAAYPRGDQALPAFSLVDQSGRRVDNASLAGRPTLLTFGFANCATICPVVVENTRQAADRLGGAAGHLVVTLDPWRDRPSRLVSLAKRWNMRGDARVLSGEISDVVALLESLKAAGQRDEKTGDLLHPPLVYVLNSKGNIAYSFSNPPVDWLVQAVRRLNEAGT